MIPLLLALLLSSGQPAYAKSRKNKPPTAAASAVAMRQAIELLANPSTRAAAIARGGQAAELDGEVKAAAGGDEQTVQEIYGVASDVYRDLVVHSNGDPMKAIATLQTAKTDPKVLLTKLSPMNQLKILRLAAKIAAKKAQTR